jgi:hypothetical protein
MDEMRFIDNELYVDCKCINLYNWVSIKLIIDSWWELAIDYGSEYTKFYPQSQQDRETLIRLFTKP